MEERPYVWLTAKHRMACAVPKELLPGTAAIRALYGYVEQVISENSYLAAVIALGRAHIYKRNNYNKTKTIELICVHTNTSASAIHVNVLLSQCT